MTNVIDLFAGCGGLSCGFEKAGFKIVAAVEFDKMIANSYKHNHKGTKVYAEDIKIVDQNKYFSYRDADVIIGGPPCQGFSMAGARIRKNGFIEDPRNYLFKHYFNIVKVVKPKLFIIENVKGILTLKNGEIFKEIINIFTNPENFNGEPYKIQYKLLKAKEIGIPQARERVIIVGSLFDFDLDKALLKAKNEILKNNNTFFDSVSVWDAISDLPEPTESGIISNLESKTQYQKSLSNNGNTYNHTPHHHTQKAIERMSRIKIDENYTSLNEDIKSIHSGSYGRLNPNGIAPTITTRFDTPSGGKFIHPYQNRTISPREAARLQSFPDSFEFVGNQSSICKQIGNAVPPKLAYYLAIMIREVLNENK